MFAMQTAFPTVCSSARMLQVRQNLTWRDVTEAEGPRKTTVLLVDDEEKIIRFVALKLKLFGYRVITASDGLQALDCVKTAEPDIILLDILMPVVDGFEVLEKLRKFSQLPVIAISAKGDNADRAMELGANDFISKPFKPDELVERIEANLDRRGKP
jgi:two-component system, OmpR family, response regulator RpaB